jgi:hypothetical protein
VLNVVGQLAALVRRVLSHFVLLLRLVLELGDILRGRRLGRPEPRPRRWIRLLRGGPLLPRLVSIFSWWPVFIKRVIHNLRQGEDVAPQPDAVPLDDFPRRIPVYAARIENFDGNNAADSVWHAIPWTKHDLVEIAAWAVEHRYAMRPLGNNHSWSPMQVGGDEARRVILVDLKRLRTQEIGDDRKTARFSASLTIEEASRFLDRSGYALPISTAAGEVTLGGVLAVGGHGSGVATGPGATFGHRVQSVEVLATREGNPTYQLVEFTRTDDPDFMSALTLALGSILIVEITVSIERAKVFESRTESVRMRRYLGVSPGVTGLLRWPFPSLSRSRLAKDLAGEAPKLELMWIPHQGVIRGVQGMRMIRRGWKVAEHVPLELAAENEPYRDRLVNWAAHDTDVAVRNALRASQPELGRRVAGDRMQTMLWASTVRADDTATQLSCQLYSSRFILRFHAASWCLIVRREAVGRALHRAASELMKRQQKGSMSLDGPVEVRITQTDPDEDDTVALSPARTPRGVDPNDVYAVWFNILTDLGDDQAGWILHDFERWLLERAPGDDSGIVAVRPEWSKGAAYDAQGRPWRDERALTSFRREFEAYDRYDWKQTKRRLDTLDASHLFRSPLARLAFEAHDEADPHR